MSAVRVAIDVGPLAGRRTGIGVAVEAMRAALARRDDIELHPYLSSFRARPTDGVRRLPLPAALAHRCWSIGRRPRMDHWLGDIDIVHGTNYVVPPSRHPRVVTVYDCWFLDHPEDAVADVRRSGRVLTRAVAGGAVVHACSHATADAVRRHLPDAEVHTIPLAAIALAAPTDHCPVPELEGPPFILAIGTLERRKNLPALIAAFGLLTAEHPELRLVLVGGDGDDRPSVDQAILDLATKHGTAAAARVLLTGFVTDDVRSWLLHHATVLAYPSLDEGFGFPLLDAMQASLPIVATRVGSIPEVAGAAALLSAPGDVAELSSHLGLAISDHVVRERLIAAAAPQLATFDWARTAHGLADLYRRLHERPEQGDLR